METGCVLPSAHEFELCADVCSQVTKRMTKKKQDKHSRIKTFVKLVNYTHLMPTRYTLDVDLKSTVTADVMENATKKVAARKEVSRRNTPRVNPPTL